MMDWMIQIPPKVTNAKKRKNRGYADSLHREKKQERHITVGGKGIIARLRKKKSNK